MKILLDEKIKSLPIEELADAARASYRAAVKEAIRQGKIRPTVVPYILLSTVIVPALYLAIPHTRQPWIYQARWAVVALVSYLSLDGLWETTSANTALGYAIGLVAAWGVMSSLTLLVWTRPQFDAARIIKRSKHADQRIEYVQHRHVNGSTTAQSENLRQRKPNGNSVSSAVANEIRPANASDLNNEFVWQPYPVDAPFSERLNWSLDLITNVRLIGWNWSISCVPMPKFDPSEALNPGFPVDMGSMPVMTKAGYRRHLSEAEFIRTRSLCILAMYLLLDFLATYMVKDPYFVLGPDQLGDSPALPSYLAGLPWWLLLAYRQIFTIAGAFAALNAALNASDLVQWRWSGRFIPVRGELWQYPSVFGSFSRILDRGLAGMWGDWWHQTFRLQFIGPTVWLTDAGYLVRHSTRSLVAGAAISFAISGLLHASASIGSPPMTKPWRPALFFALQFVGIVVQRAWTETAGARLEKFTPRMVARLGNLLFAVAWLACTSKFFVDDLASAGIWLLEPVPISLFRALGFGHPGESCWRWGWHYIPGWFSAEHWWQTGISI